MSTAVRTGSMQRQSLEPIARLAPFVFVEQYLASEHHLAFLWFDSYEIIGLIENGGLRRQIGTPYRQTTTQDEVEALTSTPLDEDSLVTPMVGTETQDRLRTEIESYFRAYYSTLRDQIAAYHEQAEDTEPRRGTHGFAEHGSVPDLFRGAKVVRTFFCNDSVAIVHYPAQTRQDDTYSFEDRSWATVQGVIRAATPPYPNEDRVGMLVYESGQDFGADSVPLGELSREFRGRFDEMELLMFPSEESVDLVLQIDRRARGLGSFLSEAIGTDESYVGLTIPEGATPGEVGEMLAQTMRQHA